jgi:hypothetical protein
VNRATVVVGRVRATGRRKALRAVQERYGGMTQGTGSFSFVPLSSELGSPPVRILTESELRELQGSLGAS